MTTSHLTLVPTTRLPRNEFGQTILQDHDTNESWWNLRDDAEPTSMVILAVNEPMGPATYVEPSVEGVREPDMYDDGRAVWLTTDAVVTCDIEAMTRIPEILASQRYVFESGQQQGQGLRLTQLHPSHYGVDVDSFYDTANDVDCTASHAAQEAWGYFAKAVNA